MSSEARAPQGAPNIVLLTVDCWRADHLGAAGALAQRGGPGHAELALGEPSVGANLEPAVVAPSPTPQLDRLAAEGALFEQAITAAGWTRPALLALFSSTYASMYGGPLGRFAPERPSLPELLRAQGYETAGFTTNPQVGRLFGFERGFDTFVELEPGQTHAGPSWAKVKGAQRLLRETVTHQLLRPLGLSTLPAEITVPAEQVSAEVAAWAARPRTRPFFVWAHYMDAHWPYHVLRRVHRAREVAQAWRDRHLMHQIEGRTRGQVPLDASLIARWRALYREAVAYADEHIGRLVAHLRASPAWPRTAVIVTADHGEEFYEHRRWGHFQLFDESVRVPLVARVPGHAPGRRVARQVSLLDLAPTLLGLAGAPPPAAMAGTSLLPLLDGNAGGAPTAGREAYAEMMWKWKNGWAEKYLLAIRDERYKYLYNSHQPQAGQLYDLQADPDEQHNVYGERPDAARFYDDLRQAHEARARATAAAPGEAVEVEMDPVVVERLQALGYWG